MSSTKEKKDDLLQAVVIVDAWWGDAFFASGKPRALIPLANVPLLDYTLECLDRCGVGQTFVFCCNYYVEVWQYLRASSKWLHDSSTTMNVSVLTADNCLSVGDVLRDLDNRSLVRSDFLLVFGNLVSNANLKTIVDRHRRRRDASSKVLLTLVYKRAAGHDARSGDVVIVTQPIDDRIIAYRRCSRSSRTFRLPTANIFDESRAQLRFDLLDSRVVVCSPIALQMMTDNFDYRSIDDLVCGILASEGVMDFTIHAHVLDGDQYAASVLDAQSYCRISTDVMNRWAYPMTPDGNLLGKADDRYAYARRNIYRHRDALVDANCLLVRNVAIGKDSRIGSNAVLEQTVVGKRCSVGTNAHLLRCYILDDVEIANDCQLVDCIVCDGVVIEQRVKLGPYALVGKNVRVSSRQVVQPNSALMTKSIVDEILRLNPDYRDIVELTRYETTAVGDKTWYSSVDVKGENWNVACSITDDEDDDEDDAEEECVDDDKNATTKTDKVADESEEEARYYDEIVETLYRAIDDENVGANNALLEINSIKCAYDLDMRHLIEMLARAVAVDLPLRRDTTSGRDVGKYVINFKRCVETLRSLLLNYVNSAVAQNWALRAIECFARRRLSIDAFAATFSFVVQYLYKMDVLSEDCILLWWTSLSTNDDVRAKIEPFINWLKTAEEESDDDE